MLKNKKIITVLCLLFGLFYVYNNNVFAAGLRDYTVRFGDAAYDNSSSDKVKDPAVIIGQVIKWFLAILGIIFFILTVNAGYLWMTASGNEDQVAEAKKKMVNALAGLIIVLAAYALTYMVLENFTDIIFGRF